MTSWTFNGLADAPLDSRLRASLKPQPTSASQLFGAYYESDQCCSPDPGARTRPQLASRRPRQSSIDSSQWPRIRAVRPGPTWRRLDRRLPARQMTRPGIGRSVSHWAGHYALTWGFARAGKWRQSYLLPGKSRPAPAVGDDSACNQMTFPPTLSNYLWRWITHWHQVPAGLDQITDDGSDPTAQDSPGSVTSNYSNIHSWGKITYSISTPLGGSPAFAA